MPINDPWTQEMIDVLRLLWSEGLLSAAMIADEIYQVSRRKVTRCAVIGKAHRLKLDHRQPARRVDRKPARPRRIPRPDAPPRTPIVSVRRDVQAKRLAHEYRPCTLMDLRDDQCRWPVDDLYCGTAVVDGQPYCSSHLTQSRVPKRPGASATYPRKRWWK